MNVRISTAAGIITIQVSLHGRGIDQKLEVTGVQRSGLETKRTVFLLKQDQAVDMESFKTALDQALND